MPIIEFSPADLLRGKLVETAWYTVKIESIDEGKPSKDGQSTNYGIEVSIIRNGESGDTTFAGVPVIGNFNSKAKGFMAGLFAALGVGVETGQRYELKNAAGQVVDAFIDNREWEGSMRNNLTHKYRAVKNPL